MKKRIASLAVLVAVAAAGIAQGQPPQFVPYRDVVVPAQHWRLHESYELRYSLFGGPYYQRRAIWVPMYPATGGRQ